MRVKFLGTDNTWPWAPMKKLFGVAQLEEARSCTSSIKKHDELKSFGRFCYQEIRDFLNSKHTVTILKVRSPFPPCFSPSEFLQNTKPFYLFRTEKLGAHSTWVWKLRTCSTTQCKYLCHCYRSSTSSSKLKSKANIYLEISGFEDHGRIFRNRHPRPQELASVGSYNEETLFFTITTEKRSGVRRTRNRA